MIFLFQKANKNHIIKRIDWNFEWLKIVVQLLIKKFGILE